MPETAIIRLFAGGTVYLDALLETLQVTLPVFLILSLGVILRLRGQLNEGFLQASSSLVFNICLPLLMFLAIIDRQVDLNSHISLVLFCLSASVAAFIFFWFASSRGISAIERGVVVQGAFRSNLGVIGLALCINAFGSAGLSISVVILAVVTPVFNILSVFALNHSANAGRPISLAKTCFDIVKNPLIISILLATLFSLLDLTLPKVLYDAGSYLARMTLPLALLVIGGSLSFRELKKSRFELSWAVIGKLAVMPVIVVFFAYLAGFDGVALGCILLMFASPTAAASFVMVRLIGGNFLLASNIIVISTILSAFTISVLLFSVKIIGLV